MAQGTPKEILTPELIREIYEVDAELYTDYQGQIHILYHAQHRKQEKNPIG